MNTTLITELRVTSNGALKSNQLPTRIKIFNAGINRTTKGDFVAGQKTLQKLEANQRALGFERVALDFNHCSVEGSASNKLLLSMGRPPLIFGYDAADGCGGWDLPGTNGMDSAGYRERKAV